MKLLLLKEARKTVTENPLICNLHRARGQRARHFFLSQYNSMRHVLFMIDEVRLAIQKTEEWFRRFD